MTTHRWLLAASPVRTLVEAAVVTAGLGGPVFALLVGLPEPAGRAAGLVNAAAAAGLVGALVGALRRRPTPAASWPVVEAAMAGLVLLSISLAALLASVPGALLVLGPRPAAAGATLAQLATTLAVIGAGLPLALPTYLLARALALAWPAWERRRRQRLVVALTHAQLVAGLWLALIAASVIGLRSALAADLPAQLLAGTGQQSLLARIVIVGLPAMLALVVLGVGLVSLVLPLIGLLSWRVLRRPLQRLEALATTAERLRAGDLSARVPVTGEDEVARLQATFNGMAADLERLVGELQIERDTVARMLADRRALMATVSHELRTPVAILRGYLDSLRSQVAAAPAGAQPPASLAADLTIMADETEHLQHLIDDLFTVARAAVGQLPLDRRPTDVAALLQRCRAAIGPTAWRRGRIELVAELAAALPPALVDPDRLEQVIANLVANAIRHTPPGGFVILSATAADSTIVVQVTDTGEGIASDDLPHIFERFYRAGRARDRDWVGAGLGLALVKELTEAMGGSVGVTSEVDQGSTFTLRLPRA